ncbi:MAG TPA: nucleotide pyrophosphohydrolase [Microlunatus sp.]
MTDASDLMDLRDRMRRFTDERDWSRYHDPKSLLLALVGEVGELSELFQWLPADSARNLAQDQPLRARVEEEIADVLLYLVRLADVLEIDLGEAAVRKFAASSQKHRPGSGPDDYRIPKTEG